MSDSSLEKLLARQEIYDALCRYCRGLDRMDKEMAYSVWHEDGTALYYGMYDGSGHGFVDWVWEAHRPMESIHALARGNVGDTSKRDHHDPSFKVIPAYATRQ